MFSPTSAAAAVTCTVFCVLLLQEVTRTIMGKKREAIFSNNNNGRAAFSILMRHCVVKTAESTSLKQEVWFKGQLFHHHFPLRGATLASLQTTGQFVAVLWRFWGARVNLKIRFEACVATSMLVDCF